MRKLKTYLAALVSAAALAFSAAAPAAAMNDDDLAALLMLLGKGPSGFEANRPVPQYFGRPGNGYWDDDNDQVRPFFLNGREERSQQWNHDRRRDRIIPVQCVFPIRTADGRRNVVSTRCLSDFDIGRRLPRDCAFETSVRGDRRMVYGARCLERYGYRFAEFR